MMQQIQTAEHLLKIQTAEHLLKHFCLAQNSSIDPLTNPSPAQVYFPCIVLQLSDGHAKILIASYWLTQVLTSNLGPEFFQLLNVAGLSGHFRGNRLQQRWL